MNEQRQPGRFFTTVYLHIQRSSKAVPTELLDLCTGGMQKGVTPAPPPPGLLSGKKWLNFSAWTDTTKSRLQKV